MTAIAERDTARTEVAKLREELDAARYPRAYIPPGDERVAALASLAKKSARQHARERGALDGADAQALEHALTMTERERDEARANYQFMVDRAADEKLDGYRELASRLAAAENDRDEAIRQAKKVGKP